MPLPELYRICEAAREILDRYRVGRVIARPFVGEPGAFRRTYNRRDFSLRAARSRRCSIGSRARAPVVGVGKI